MFCAVFSTLILRETWSYRAFVAHSDEWVRHPQSECLLQPADCRKTLGSSFLPFTSWRYSVWTFTLSYISIPDIFSHKKCLQECQEDNWFGFWECQFPHMRGKNVILRRCIGRLIITFLSISSGGVISVARLGWVNKHNKAKAGKKLLRKSYKQLPCLIRKYEETIK